MKATIKQKKPGDRLDYDLDFRRWLPDGDHIVTASATVSDGDVVVDDVDFSQTAAKVWLSGGVVGETVVVKVTVLTDQGREKLACFRLAIKEKC